jgi:hypothetical protein
VSILVTPDGATTVFSDLAGIARAVPAYELRLGTHANDIPRVIIDLLAELRANAGQQGSALPATRGGAA